MTHFLMKKIPIQSLASLFSFLLCQWLIRLEFFYRKCLRLTSWSYVWKRDESWSADQSNAFILFSSKRSGAGVLLFLSFGTPVSLNVALISRGLLSLLWPSNPIFFYWWPLLRERIRAREWATWWPLSTLIKREREGVWPCT